MDLVQVAKSVLATKQGCDVSNQCDKKKGKVIQRNYVMNDVGALRRAHVGISIISNPEVEAKQRNVSKAMSQMKADKKKDKKNKNNL